MTRLKIKDGINTEIKLKLAMMNQSQKDFAHIIDISPSYLSRILSGNDAPGTKTAYKIANGLGWSVEYIFKAEGKNF